MVPTNSRSLINPEPVTVVHVVGDTVPQSVGLRSPGPARKGNLPHRGGTQDGVVLQRVLVPLKQVGSSRAARICPKAFASCPCLSSGQGSKNGPAFLSPYVLCWSPQCFVLVVLASPAVPVPMRPHIISTDFLRRAGNATSKISLGRRTLFFQCTTYG